MVCRIWLFLCLINGIYAQHSLTPLSSEVEILFPSQSMESEITKVQSRIVKGLLLVSGKVESREGYFVLDTGAPGLVINRKPINPHQSVAAHGLNGAVELGEEVLSHVEWGNGAQHNIEVLTMDLSHLEQYTELPILGLLGYESIKDYEMLINYPRKDVYWIDYSNSALHQSEGNAITCHFELVGHLPIITLHIDSIILRFALDTGSGINVLKKERLPSISKLNAKRGEPIQLQSLDQSNGILPSYILPSVDLGGLVKEDIVFHVKDLTKLEEVLGAEIDGIIGYQFLKEHQVIINYKKQEMTLLD